MKDLYLWLAILLLYAYAMFHGAVAYFNYGLIGMVAGFAVVVILSGIILISIKTMELNKKEDIGVKQ